MASHEPVPGLRKIPENMPVLLRPPGEMPGDEARDRFWNMVALTVTVSVALAAVGVWSYAQVRDSLARHPRRGPVLAARGRGRGLPIWIDEKKRDAERWATDRRCSGRGRARAARAAGMDPAAVCALAARRTLLAEIAPYVVLEEAVAVNLIARDGTIIASQSTTSTAAGPLRRRVRERVAPVFSGRTVFVRPFLERERLGDGGGSRSASPWSGWRRRCATRVAR